MLKMVDVETVMTGLMDEFPTLRPHRFKVLLIVCVIFFFVGLPLVTQVVILATPTPPPLLPPTSLCHSALIRIIIYYNNVNVYSGDCSRYRFCAFFGIDLQTLHVLT